MNAPRSCPKSWLSIKRVAHGRGVESDEGALSTRGGIVDGMREQGFSRAGLTEKNDRDVRTRGQSGQTEATSHRVVRSRQVFDLEAGKGTLHNDLVAHVLAQLPNRFEGVFDHRASPYHDARFTAHSDAQRQMAPLSQLRFVD